MLSWTYSHACLLLFLSCFSGLFLLFAFIRRSRKKVKVL
jgi:hypothetical protein